MALKGTQMARHTNLIRRGAVYYALVHVPADLQAAMGGKKQIWRSLETKDYGEAKRRLTAHLDQWTSTVDDMRRRRDLTDADIEVAVWDHYTAKLEEGDRERASRPTTAEIDAAIDKAMADARQSGAADAGPIAMINAMADVEVLANKATWAARRRTSRLNRLRADLASGDTRFIEADADRFLTKHGFNIERGGTRYRELCFKLMRADIEQLERYAERDKGDYTGTPKDPIVKPATSTPREQAKPGETIMELFEQYARENPKGITADTINQARRDIGTFVDHVGGTCPVRRMDKKAVREWKALLVLYPVKATESKAFAGMKLAQIVRHNETVGKPVITSRTVNRYLSSLGAFCDWLVAHGYLDQNPTVGMSLAKEKKKTTLPFTTDQLNTLFKSPLFTGCQSSDEWRNVAKPGNVMIRDHRYWVPLIMLFSGARPAEIAQLAVADVRQEHGHWIFHITTEGDGEKSVKTEGSMRVVPVHPELIKLGFIKYRDGMEKAGHTRLFPEAKRNARGQMIAEFSREFGRYLTRLEMKNGRGLSLYSFRHGAVDALRRAGHLDEQFGFILGHTSATMTGRYGIMPQGMLEQRVELVNSIAYPGLSIDHLF